MWRLGFKIIVLLSALLAVQNLAALPVTESDNYLAEMNAKIEKAETLSKKTADSVRTLQDTVSKLGSAITLQTKQINGVKESVNHTDAVLDKVIAEMRADRLSVEERFSMFILYGMAGLLIALMTAMAIYLSIRKKIKNNDRDIKSVIDTIAANSGENHSLVLSIVNEMARIEQNLSYMDTKTKGVQQLRNRVAAISSALVAYGYEVPKLINTEYREGMNYQVVMEEDETVAPHEQRIKRVMQPCVIYNGLMIQTAKVVVAYNPDYDN